MQKVLHDNFLIIRLEKADEKIMINPEKIVGYLDEGVKFLKRDKNHKQAKSYGFYLTTGGEEGTAIFTIKGDLDRILELEIKENESFYVSKEYLVAFEDTVVITGGNKHFYPKASNDTLIKVSGKGKLFLQYNGSAFLSLEINDKNNSFNANNILLFEDTLQQIITKHSTRKHTVVFQGRGKVFLRS